MMGDDDGSIDGGKHAADFLLDEIAQALPVAGARRHRRDDAGGRRHADVSRDQQLFERLDGVDVDRTRPPLALVRRANELVEPRGDLLCGAGEAFAYATKK